MEEIFFKVNLGITFVEKCVIHDDYNIIGHPIFSVMRYYRIRHRTHVMDYDVGWTAQDFIGYYKILHDLQKHQRRNS